MAGQIPNYVPGDQAHLYADLLKATQQNINYLPGKPKEEPKEKKYEVEVKPTETKKGKKTKE